MKYETDFIKVSNDCGRECGRRIVRCRCPSAAEPFSRQSPQLLPCKPNAARPRTGSRSSASCVLLGFQSGIRQGRGLHQHATAARSRPSSTMPAIASIKDKIQQAGIYVSSLAVDGNHIDPDPAQARASRTNTHRNASSCAANSAFPNIGGQSGTDQGQPLQEQVDEIVRVYTEKYFPLARRTRCASCGSPMRAARISPPARSAGKRCSRRSSDSPHVGLQFDPSHLVWQFMDPVQAARDFVDKIYDVHLKDTEILWHVVRRAGIQPVNNARLVALPHSRLRLGRLEGLFLGAGGGGLHRRHEHRERRRVLLSGVRRRAISPSSTSAASAWRTSS